MPKPPPILQGPPSFAVATGVPRVVFHNPTPQLIAALREVARLHGVPERQLTLTSPHLDH